MKRLIFFGLSLFFAASAFSQAEINSTYFNQTDLQGTARYMSMGGAFNALGGDATSIGNNPAGLGIYRSSELSFTTNLSVNHSNMETSTSTVGRNGWNFAVNNLAIVASFMSGRERGLVASNFAFTYNQLKNFRSYRQMKTGYSSSSMLGYITQPYSTDDLYYLAVDAGALDEEGVPYFNTSDSDNEMSIKESGSLSEANFTYGGNISNIFYFGAGLGIRILDYSMRSTYYESFFDGGDAPVGDFELQNSLETAATGFNFKFGAIVRPVDWLRIGAAFQTPTWFYAEDTYESFGSSYAEGDGVLAASGPAGYYPYDINTPLKLNFGLAAVIAKKGIISVDYEMEDFSKLDFQELELGMQNEYIGMDFQPVHTLRIGAEYRITPEFSARAGYALATSPVKEEIQDMVVVGTDPHFSLPRENSFYSIGLGYRARYFFIDGAYVLNIKKDDFYPYPTAGAVKATSSIHNVVCTLGWRF